MARYSLWVKNKKDSSKDFIYQIQVNGNMLDEKTDLFTIDLFTSEYKDEHELLSSILKRSNVDDYKLEITYQSNKRMRKLDVAYFDDVLIKNYSHIYNNKFIPKSDSDLITILNYVLNSKFSSNGIIKREINDSKYINDYIKEKIDLYVYNRNSWDNSKRVFAREKLLEELTRYKNIRGIMFFLKSLSQKYELKLPNITDKVNITPKFYQAPVIDDNLDDIDKIEIPKDVETEFNFNDPYARNYDDIDFETDESTTSNSKSRSKVYTKKISGQVSFLDINDDK